MKVLRLTLKKKWFDMIASGEKKEEYREIKPYWFGRLVFTSRRFDIPALCQSFKTELPGIVLDEILKTSSFHFHCPEFIEFRNGYAKDAPHFTIECKGLGIGKQNMNWGAPVDENVFFFTLGSIIETKNFKPNK